MRLTIFDSEGTPLKVGDLVMIQEKRNDGLTFFSRIAIKCGRISPLDKFAFDRIVKIDKIPDECRHVTETDETPEYWMHPNTELRLINDDRLEKWKMDRLFFEHNAFYKVEL